MNSLIILPEELRRDGRAVVSGTRALYLYETHELKVGVTVKASLYGGKRGHANVLEAQRDYVELDVIFDIDAPVRSPISLIIAVPRPQTIKKVVQYAATIGIQSIHFIKTYNVEKSYLQSKSLSPEALNFEVIKGLEQTFDSIAPAIHVHKNYSIFMNTVLPSLLGSAPARDAFIFDTQIDAASQEIRLVDSAQIFLAIGPESGWLDKEVHDFKNAGFKSLSLGARILRVEHALISAVSRIEYRIAAH